MLCPPFSLGRELLEAGGNVAGAKAEADGQATSMRRRLWGRHV